MLKNCIFNSQTAILCNFSNPGVLESPWYPFGVRKNFGKADVIIKTGTAEDDAAPELGVDLDAQQKAGPWGHLGPWAISGYLLDYIWLVVWKCLEHSFVLHILGISSS